MLNNVIACINNKLVFGPDWRFIFLFLGSFGYTSVPNTGEQENQNYLHCQYFSVDVSSIKTGCCFLSDCEERPGRSRLLERPPEGGRARPHQSRPRGLGRRRLNLSRLPTLSRRPPLIRQVNTPFSHLERSRAFASYLKKGPKSSDNIVFSDVHFRQVGGILQRCHVL